MIAHHLPLPRRDHPLVSPVACSVSASCFFRSYFGPELVGLDGSDDWISGRVGMSGAGKRGETTLFSGVV
jgi:hypothetical protein